MPVAFSPRVEAHTRTGAQPERTPRDRAGRDARRAARGARAPTRRKAKSAVQESARPRARLVAPRRARAGRVPRRVLLPLSSRLGLAAPRPAQACGLGRVYARALLDDLDAHAAEARDDAVARGPRRKRKREVRKDTNEREFEVWYHKVMA
jgi:hypothetical protein